MIEMDLKPTPLLRLYESMGYKPELVDDRKVFRYFSSFNEEFNALYKGAGLRDISGSGMIELTGRDVLDFLHRISTNAVKDLQRYSVCQTIFTTEKGRIIDKAVIMNYGDSIATSENHQLLICSAVHESKLKRWIEKYIIMDDVKLNELNNKYVLFELLGPQADSFMTLVCGRAVNELGINKFKLINTDGLSFYTLKFIDKNGSVKFWLLSSIEHGAGLVNYMLNNKGIFDFKLIGEDAFNCYRISSGIPAAPNELNDLYNPHEAGLIDLVNFKKGCYIGQEVIARLDTYDKVQKFLKGILFLEPVAMNLPFELFDESGNEAGNVTSIAFSPKYGNQIGLAYLKKAFIQQSRASTDQIEPFLYTKSINGSRIKVKIEDLPFNHGRAGLPTGQTGLPTGQAGLPTGQAGKQ